MSDTDFYDFVVIGGGSAGYAAGSTAARLGLRVMVIEGGDEVGGLCILRGCMPSKTLLESAHRAENIRRAGDFGLRAEFQGADGEAIRSRKRELIGGFAGYRQEQLESGQFSFLRGWAQFSDPHTLQVQLRDGATVTVHGRTFLVATGSHIRWLDVPGLKETGVLTSDDVLDSSHVPKSVIILGAGPTGLEFASYFAGLGAEVMVVQRSEHILRGVDEDIADALLRALTKRGIRFHTRTSLKRLERDGAVKRVWFATQDQGECSVEAEQIVYALGRRPATERLGLEHAGVELSPHGSIRINTRQQSSASHIFAAGDVSGPYEIVHIAVQQAEIAARNAGRLLRGEAATLEEMDYTLKLFAVFTHPEVASVGLTAREAAGLGLRFIEACYPFDDHGKSMVRGETDGFVKLLAAGDDRKIIGGAVIGPEAAELIHEIVVAMRFGATAAQLAAIPHYHPTLSEIWTYPAEALALAEVRRGTRAEES